MELVELSKHVPSPGDEYLFAMMHPKDFGIVSGKELLHSPVAQWEYLTGLCWIISLHWLYKKRFCKTHNVLKQAIVTDLASSKKMANKLERLGHVLYAALLLIEYVFLYVDRCGFDSHWTLFQGVSVELFRLCYGKGSDNTKTSLAKNIRGLKDAVLDRRPYDIGFSVQNLDCLMSAVYSISTRSSHGENIERLLKDPKTGLLPALTKWATAVETETGFVNTVRVSNNALLFNEGRGRAMQRVTAEKIVIEEKRRLKYMQSKDSKG